MPFFDERRKCIQSIRDKVKLELEDLRNDILPCERKPPPPQQTADEPEKNSGASSRARFLEPVSAARVRPLGTAVRKIQRRRQPWIEVDEQADRLRDGHGNCDGGGGGGGSGGRCDSDEEGEEEEDEQEEDGGGGERAEDAFCSKRSSSVKERCNQVRRACQNGGMAQMQSPVFRPNDPMKSSSNLRRERHRYPTVYVHANHLYYASQGVPHQPPCKKHGWKAVEDGQVIGKGWKAGRRVLGVIEDWWMIGTSHLCKLCKTENDVLKARAAEWKGDATEKQRRVAEWKNHSYKFSSYDPAVTRLYHERFPWIGPRNLVVVCTKKTAMTLELAVLLETLMTTAAKKTVEGAARNVARWTVLRSKDKDYLDLMERVRSGSYYPHDDVAAIVPPHALALPPLPLSAATRSSKDGRAAAGPLVPPRVARVSSSRGSAARSICSSCGKEGGAASAQTAGGAAGDAKTGGGTEGDAHQMSYPQAKSAAATATATVTPAAATSAAAAAAVATATAAATAAASASASATAAADLQPISMDDFPVDADQHQGARLGGVAPGVKEVTGSGVSRLTPGVGEMALGVVGEEVRGIGSAGVSLLIQGAGRVASGVGGVAPGVRGVAPGVRSADVSPVIQDTPGVAPSVGGMAPGVGEVPQGAEGVPPGDGGVPPGMGGVAQGAGWADLIRVVQGARRVSPGVGGVAPGVGEVPQGAEGVPPGDGGVALGVKGVAPGAGSADVTQVVQGARGVAPSVDEMAPGAGGVPPGIEGVEPGVGSADLSRVIQDAWGVAPGVGGVVPGVGGVVPGVGGMVPNVGGLVPGVGSADVTRVVQGAWGVAPGVVGLMPGFGGFVPGLGGLMQGFGSATFGGVLPMSTLTAVHAAAAAVLGGAAPPRQWIEPAAAVASKKRAPLTSAERQRRHRAKRARKEGETRTNSEGPKSDGAKVKLLGTKRN